MREIKRLLKLPKLNKAQIWFLWNWLHNQAHSDDTLSLRKKVAACLKTYSV